jgi:hypothetical protein
MKNSSMILNEESDNTPVNDQFLKVGEKRPSLFKN